MNLEKYSDRAGGVPPDEPVPFYEDSQFEDHEEDEQNEDGVDDEYEEDESCEDYKDLGHDKDPVPEVIPDENSPPKKMTRSAEDLPYVDTTVTPYLPPMQLVSHNKTLGEYLARVTEDIYVSVNDEAFRRIVGSDGSISYAVNITNSHHIIL
jgi:hypothetical protein